MDHKWEIDEEGKFSCRFNEGCHCDLPECGCCGWNPEVARKRLREWIEKMKPLSQKSEISASSPPRGAKGGCAAGEKEVMKDGK